MRKLTSGLATVILITYCILVASKPVRAQDGGSGLAQHLTISPSTIPAGQYGVSYKAQTFKASGGKSPYKYSVSSGNLPRGLSLSDDGVLSGTPAASGVYAFTIKAQDAGKGNKAITGTQNYTINSYQASLTITANNASMTQGGPVPPLTVSYSGFVNGDNASSLTIQPIVTTTGTSLSPAGTYPITAIGAVDINYNIGYVGGTLTINPASTPPGGGGGTPPGGGVTNITVTAQPETKQYGAPDPQLAYTVTGLPNGTTTSIFTGSLARNAGENTGSYAITQGTLTAGDKYKITFKGNYLTITQAEQQISWTQSLVVGCNTATQLPLSATASSGLPVTYQVSNPNVATVSGNQLTLHNPGTSLVIATQEGDANHAAAAAVIDTVVYQPESLINQHWSDVIFFDNSGGDFVSWQWYKNGDSIPGADLSYYSESPSLDGQYYVLATNKTGKQIQSCTLTITGDSTIPQSVRVYPNPAKVGTQVTVTGNYPSTALQGAILQVIDLNGRVRSQVTPVQPSMQLTMPAQTGLYIINLLLAGGQKASANVLVN